MNVHSTACIHSDSQISTKVLIGPYSIIDKGVVLEEGVEVGAFCHIYEGVTLQKNVKVFDGCILGSAPQDLKHQKEPSFVLVEEGTQIREYTTINGSTIESPATVIGKHCLLMSSVHIAHDCQLGDRLILASGVQLAGHVFIGSDTVVGGMSGFHQWSSVGQGCYIAGMVKIDKDILPFSKVLGQPISWAGINVVGLEKQNFRQEEMSLKRIYRGSNSEDSLTQLIKADLNPLHKVIFDFLNQRKLRPLLPTWL